MNIRISELIDSRDTVNKWMERFGVRFGVYKKGIFNEQAIKNINMWKC